MSNTLRELLSKLDHLDDENLPADFDAASLVGDVKDKVDAIKWRIDSWLNEAKQIETQWIAELSRRKEALEKKALRLKEYLHSQMNEHGYDKLPGKMFRVALQKAAPSVEVFEDPTAQHMLTYPDYVVQSVNYRWNKDAIRERLQNGSDLSFAKLRHLRYVKFFAMKQKDEK